MKISLKWIVLLETALIVLLLVIIVSSLKNTTTTSNQDNNATAASNYTYGLLSPSVNAGALKPQSFLIFNFHPLQEYLYQVIQTSNFDVSIYVQNLRDGNNFKIQGDKGAFPASLNKIPIAVLILNKIEKGELNYDTPIKIDKLLLVNDSDKMYFQNDQLTVRVLLERMLKESDNTAFQHLSKEVNMNDLNSLMYYYDVDAEHSYTYSSESDMEDNALLTPQSFSNMFSSLYYSTILNAKDSEYILELLTNTNLNMNEIAKLPNNVTVSHKWGYYAVNNSSNFNDCGIMYIGNGKILYCIIIRNQNNPTSLGVLGGIVHSIYQFYIGQTQSLSEFKKNLTTGTK
jgi:beta-lactamase class A